MNIACDARALIGPTTGVGRWTSEVMGGLAARHGHRVLLAASKPFEPEGPLRADGVTCLPRPAVPWPGTLWIQAALPGLLGRSAADVHVGSLAVLPRRASIPMISMVHDITPRTHPAHHTLANRICFNAYIASSLAGAARVVVGSAATEAELLRHFPEVAPKVVRIGYGVDRYFSPAPAGDTGARLRERFTGGRPFVLHLGTLEPRKGLVNLVEAWDALVRRDPETPDLVLAGRPGWDLGPLEQAIARVAQPDRLHRPGYVSREDGRELLRHAALFVLASEVEGFGLPLAEAVACHSPCVAADIPALRESGGEAPVFVPPGDSGALGDGMARALDPAENRRLRAVSAARAQGLSWEPVIDAWHGLLTEVVDGFRSERGGAGHR
jgi:glycosyltransferase involved in cell wall biosynthesis